MEQNRASLEGEQPMKNILVLLFALMILSSPVQASEAYRTEKGMFSKQGAVLKRGIFNALGVPAELVTSLIREKEIQGSIGTGRGKTTYQINPKLEIAHG